MKEIRHNREKLISQFLFGEINEEDFEKEFDKLKEQKDERHSSKSALQPNELERLSDR